MFCPGCGSEQQGQYCRSCGKDLRLVRTALEKPDAITASAISARDEIGRAVADKIREVKSTKELSKVVEDVLPQIESFLETPAEKRLRRIRAGTMTAAIGLGVTLAFALLGFFLDEEGLGIACGLGLIVFFIGLGLMLNGWHFTLPEQPRSNQLPEGFPLPVPDAVPNQMPNTGTQENQRVSSITEHTTHQLPDRRLHT